MQNVDLFFLLLGAVLVLAMHAGFAFLELGTVRHKNQVNALSKILTDFSISAIAYFFIGYYISYGLHFFHMGTTLSAEHGYNLMRCFFLLTFAAAIPAIISGGIAERAKMRPQAIATFLLVALVYPFFEGIAWNGNFGLQNWLQTHFGAPFHDFAGSVVVHAMGGWIALAAVILLGARHGRYKNDGRVSAHPPSSIPFLAVGSWILIFGWFGFNVMSAKRVDAIFIVARNPALHYGHEAMGNAAVMRAAPAIAVDPDGSRNSVPYLFAIGRDFGFDAIVHAGEPAKRIACGQIEILFRRPWISAIVG